MKRFACLFVLALFACAAPVVAEPELKTEDDKTLYALGLVISKQLSAFKLTPAELAILQAGLNDGSSGKTPKVDLEEYGPKIQAFGQQPILKPGQSFEYTSACPLATSFGVMQGTYQMVTPDGDHFDIAIAPFSLHEPYAIN